MMKTGNDICLECQSAHPSTMNCAISSLMPTNPQAAAELLPVTEAMIDAALNAPVPGGSNVWVWLPQADAWTPHQTARDVMRCALQAVAGLTQSQPSPEHERGDVERVAKLEAALEHCLPLLEDDLEQGKEAKDADWEGIAYERLEIALAALQPVPRQEGEVDYAALPLIVPVGGKSMTLGQLIDGYLELAALHPADRGDEAAAQALQDHMEQHHGVVLAASEWDAAIAALRADHKQEAGR